MNTDSENHLEPTTSSAQPNLEEMGNRLVQHLSSQMELCKALEEIADCLPNNINRQACLSVTQSLNPIIHSAHSFEEDVLFPYLLERYEQDADLVATVERLRYENWEDESYASEVREAMREWIAGSPSQTAETLGYMLRGFFTGLRRHIAFEREHFLPIVKRHQNQH